VRPSLTLRRRFLLLVGAPLIILLLAETAVSYSIGVDTANQVFDYWLLDSAQSIAQEVRVRNGRLDFVADGEVLEVFEWDELDDTYFRVLTPGGQVVAGTLALPMTVDIERLRQGPLFENVRLGDRPARSVTIVRSPGTAGEFVVQVAETLNKRGDMTGRVLFIVIVKKALMFALALFAVGWAIDRGLSPLRKLMGEIGRRSARDLSPIALEDAPPELQRLVETMNSLLGRLEHSLTAHEQFIGNIAHQIRTPLAGIKLQAQLALRDTAAGPVHESLAQIERAADHMNHVNSQLLKLARAEIAFDRGPSQAPSDLVRIVRNCCEELAPRALGRDIELSFESELPVIPLAGDPVLLTEMIRNLIDNSIIYGRAGGHIWARLGTSAGRLQLSVEDDGPGIHPEHWPQIFDRFFRPPNSPGEGCGLGLPIVREIARAHGADIRLEERSGGAGTRFVVEFPPEVLAVHGGAQAA
jgi:two-component system sensor histidine kinase TctE